MRRRNFPSNKYHNLVMQYDFVPILVESSKKSLKPSPIKFVYVAISTEIWILTAFMLRFVYLMACVYETPTIYFDVYRTENSPRNQHQYVHRPIFVARKIFLPYSFPHFVKSQTGNHFCYHAASSYLNIYKRTFLFELRPPKMSQ